MGLESWQSFVDELERSVLPIYARNERRFDPHGVHGRMHICRSVLWADSMARFYRDRLGVEIDLYAVRVATAFHDSGRQGNEADLWESDSIEKCFEYLRTSSLRRRDYDEEGARYVASLIDKQGRWDLAKQVVYDADVLEIMRPCCGQGGLDGFRREHLRFAGEEDVAMRAVEGREDLREALIQRVWERISKTESLKRLLSGSQRYMTDLLKMFGGRPETVLELSVS